VIFTAKNFQAVAEIQQKADRGKKKIEKEDSAAGQNARSSTELS
jgi:hypothetical protein